MTYLHAFPGILLSGSALTIISRNKPVIAKPHVWLAAGAILGAAWWCLLWYLQWVPDILKIGDGENEFWSPWPSLQLIAMAAVGGMTAAWMFRI
jgi:hypothetical protein